MISFLKSVAMAYTSRYSDLSDFLFLFPNKRSGTFFLKYLRETMGRNAMLSPEIKSIAEFVADVAKKTVASRLDLIFMLFEQYRAILNVHAGEEDETVDFDSFRSWGETVLSDFNEVDKHLVDPDEIFKNVKDFREISSNFLTEEQRQVMAEYFGHSDIADVSKFWKDFDREEDDLSEVKKKFLHLWRVMGPLYHKMTGALDARQLASPGGVYREALKNLKLSDGRVGGVKKIVVIGFNALSVSEYFIFKQLRDADPYPGFDCYADFFWDATGPVLKDDDNSASKFVNANIKNFPCPEWTLPSLKLSDKGTLPEKMTVAASPSNSAQVKIVGNMLAELRGRLSKDAFKDARVAVVLPDENLLLPLLYSLPKGMGDVNLTMGYSFRLTSVVPFVTHLRLLYTNMREADSMPVYYHRDLRELLSHPYSVAIFGNPDIRKIIGYLNLHHKITISLSEIKNISPRVAEILSIFQKDSGALALIDSLTEILLRVADLISHSDDNTMKSRLEYDHISLYIDSLARLRDIIGEYRVDMKAATTFRLIDRMLAGQTIGFEGEPLSGLQVMGMLETRSIDFDYIYILSANERVLPMRARIKTFIPDTLRRGFGMPPSNYSESIFSYYFYRMVSRAKEVTMLYDARTGGGMRSGDVSRYVLQLRHLYAKGVLSQQDWKFRLSGKDSHDASVIKTPEIKALTEKFLAPEGDLNLSSTSLNSFRECQVRFFYQYVLGINADPEVTEFIGAIEAGNILHAMMLRLYLSETDRKRYLEKPVVVTADMIKKILQDRPALEQLLTRTVNEEHFHLKNEELDTPLTGATQMVAREILNQVVNVLRHDLQLAPLKIHGCEISERMAVEMKSGKKVNFRFAIDRLDEILIDGKPQLRIVDYKTGKIKLTADSMDAVFSGGYESEQIFQLATYAWLLSKRPQTAGLEDVRLEIYNVPNIHLGEVEIPILDDQKIANYMEISSAFASGLEAMIEGLFEDEKFRSPEDDSACNFCRLKGLCRK